MHPPRIGARPSDSQVYAEASGKAPGSGGHRPRHKAAGSPGAALILYLSAAPAKSSLSRVKEQKDNVGSLGEGVVLAESAPAYSPMTNVMQT